MAEPSSMKDGTGWYLPSHPPFFDLMEAKIKAVEPRIKDAFKKDILAIEKAFGKTRVREELLLILETKSKTKRVRLD